jgi:cytochrome b561
MLAAIRADSVNFPLLVHVAGAMLLVGTLVAAVAAVALSRSDRGAGLQRVAFRALLVGAVPAFLVMRIGAEWVKSKEHASDDATWIGIGYSVADLSLLLLIVATVLAGFALRRAKRGDGPGALGSVSAVIVSLLLLGYGIAIWAMTTKPD